MGDFTLNYIALTACVGLLGMLWWLGFSRVRRVGFIRQPCDEVIRVSNSSPRNARKPD